MVKRDLTEHEGFSPHAILTSTFETTAEEQKELMANVELPY